MRYAATVKGGLHANYSGDLVAMGTGIEDEKTRRMAQMLSNKGEFALRSILDTLIGAAPGALASYWTAEIAASTELGGVRPVVQTYVVNRNTTAQDRTDIRNALTMAYNSTANQATNLDRNPLGTR